MIDGVSSASAAPTTGGGLGGLGSDVFLQLLVAQLRYQNPMEPADATTMLQQTSQFTMVETLQGIAETQQQLMNMSQLSAGLDMVGKEVEAIGFDGLLVVDLVEGVRFSPDGVILELPGDIEVPLANVISVNVTEDPVVESGGYDEPGADGTGEGTDDGGGDPPA